ncbi:hypothetical protein [Bacteroides sp.]|uniref:hypothetical protein n=1 Tax=Bacteroides sp. TaxID=29523 RepID=UPI0025B82F58|nr:hypothetical protein [Bacteroides sp.]
METDTPIKERLVQLCDALNVTPNQFSLQIGKSREFIRKITGEIGSDALRNIIRIYPTINIMWIITGEGEKFLSPDNSGSNDNNLTNYLKEENKELKEEVKRLIQENATLSARLELYHGNSAEAAG